MKKILIILSLLILNQTSLLSQEPAQWTMTLADKGNGEVELAATVKINLPGMFSL